MYIVLFIPKKTYIFCWITLISLNLHYLNTIWYLCIPTNTCLFIDATFFPYLPDISGQSVWTFLCIIHYCHHLLMYDNTKWAAIVWYLIHNWAIAGCAVLFYKIYTDNNILSIVNRSTVIYHPVHSPVSHACVRHQHYNVVSYFKANIV